jgi:hypothetical protein
VYFDKPLDCFRSGLFAILLAEFDRAIDLIGDTELSLVEDLLRRARENEYCINHGDAFWVRAICARGCMDALPDPDTGEALGAEGMRLLMSNPSIARLGVSAVDAGVCLRGQIAPGRHARYMMRLDLEKRRVAVYESVIEP